MCEVPVVLPQVLFLVFREVCEVPQQKCLHHGTCLKGTFLKHSKCETKQPLCSVMGQSLATVWQSKVRDCHIDFFAAA